MSIIRHDRTPGGSSGTAFIRLPALVHGPETTAFAAVRPRPIAVSILFVLGFLCALAALFSQHAAEAQAHISVTPGMGTCLVGSIVDTPSVSSADNYIRGVAAIGPDLYRGTGPRLGYSDRGTT